MEPVAAVKTKRRLSFACVKIQTFAFRSLKSNVIFMGTIIFLQSVQISLRLKFKTF